MAEVSVSHCYYYRVIRGKWFVIPASVTLLALAAVGVSELIRERIKAWMACSAP
jgi:hypothetical protein